MTSRISPAFARTALVALLCLGVVVAQATAQQVQQVEPAPAPISAPATVTTAQATESGPRVRPEMPRTQATFRVARASKYEADHTTVIRISTVVLILAIVILVLVLI
jgi:hypothetical protein